MLAEINAATPMLPQDGGTPTRQEKHAKPPLSRETGDRLPSSSEPERRAKTFGDGKLRRHKTRRALHASLATLLLASVGGGYSTGQRQALRDD